MAQSPQSPSQGLTFEEKLKQTEQSTLVRLMKAFNIINGIGLIACGIGGFFAILSFNLTFFILSIYLIIFSCLLVSFECRFGPVDRTIRRYFGFLFSYMGRAVFLIFLGVLAIGMDFWGGYVAGPITIVNGIFNLVVIKVHPAFSSLPQDPNVGVSKPNQQENVVPPSNRGSVTASSAPASSASSNPYQQDMSRNPYMQDYVVQAGANYIAENPEVAVKATKAAANYVQQNPQVLTSAVNAAARASHDHP